MKQILLFLFSLLLFINFNIYTQEIFKPAYKFEKGKTYFYKDISKGKIVQEMMGQETRTDIAGETRIKFVVEDVTDDSLIILQGSIDSIYINLISKKDDQVLDLSDIVGKRMNYTINYIGKIITKKIIDPIKFKNMPQGFEVNDIIQLTLPVFSDKELKVGDKWKSSWIDTIDVMGTKVVSQNSYTYKLAKQETKNGQKFLKITYDGKINSEGNTNMMGAELYFEKEVKSEGTVYFDYELGILISDEMEVEDVTTLATTGPQSMIIPITQTMKSIRTLIDK